MNVLSIPSRGHSATPSPRLTLCFSLALCAVACGSSHPDDAPGRLPAASHAGTASPTTRWDACPLAGLDAAVTVLATADGVAMASAGAGGSDANLVVVRYRGAGCALAAAGTPLAVYALLDADARGNLYAFPAATTAPGVASTLPPDELFPTRDSLVVRINPAGQATQVVKAGRGIWRFGVSAAGGTFWSTACGPTGIFAMASEPLRPVLSPPSTRWQAGAVLTTDTTLWSVASPGCSPDTPAGRPCGYPLFRTTPQGDQVVGRVALDFTDDSQRAALFRCGERLCSVASRTITLWDDEGAALRTAFSAELGLREDEQIVHVSSNAHGIYVLLHSADGQRLLFSPLPG